MENNNSQGETTSNSAKGKTPDSGKQRSENSTPDTNLTEKSSSSGECDCDCPSVQETSSEIEETLAPILVDLPAEKREEVITKVQEMVVARHFSGPLPPPELLQGYKDIIPDSPERLLKMVENRENHKISTESIIVKHEISQSSRGQIFGFVIAIIIIFIVAYLTINSHYTVAAILGGATIIGLVTIFVLNRPPQKGSKSDES